jgi:alkylhydroperoxidase family enzyme
MSEHHQGPPRLRPLDPDEAPEVRDIFESYLEERGNIPNMFRTLGRRGQHLRTMIDHFEMVMREGSVSRLLKEFITVRVSALNSCHY